MDKFFDWESALLQTYEGFINKAAQYAPGILNVLLLILLGWIVAIIISQIIYKVIDGLDKLFQRIIKGSKSKSEKVKKSYARIISSAVFWLVLIFFISASTHLLGWTMFSKWFDRLGVHLPNLLAGLLIILLGVLIGNLTKLAIVAATQIKNVDILASIAKLVILFTAIAIGIKQIGINIDFLTNTMTVILGVFFAGGVLAFGLGSRTLISNLIASQYASKLYNIGDHLKIGNLEGKVLEITPTTIVIDSKEGRAIIPAKYLSEEINFIK